MAREEHSNARFDPDSVDGNDGRGVEQSIKKQLFTPYRSIIRSFPFPGSPTRTLDETSVLSDTSTLVSRSPFPSKKRKSQTETRSTFPWRAALGRGFFALPKPTSSSLGPGEEELYNEILSRTFQNFSDEPVGLQQERLALRGDDEGEEGDWDIDIEAERGKVEGDTEIIYESLHHFQTDSEQTHQTPSKQPRL